MFSFTAYFWDNDVYIKQNKYAANEILTAYLDTNYYDLAKELKFNLETLKNKLLFSQHMSYDSYNNYNKNVYLSIDKIQTIDQLMKKLPPYNAIIHRPYELSGILNNYNILFEDGTSEQDIITEETINEFGFGFKDEFGNYYMHLHKFILRSMEIIDFNDAEFIEIVDEFNSEIIKYFDAYIGFLDSYINVHNVFMPFVEHYLHGKGTFPTDNEVAECFVAFNKENSNAFLKIKCEMMSFGYKVLIDENENHILCEEILFKDLLSFLYYDFFKGLKNNFIPNKCKQCERFFLIMSGLYYCYCDKPLKDEPDKNCRDVGARRSYDDKCKNDPIWQTYNRAYKAHYARYMKKKMTVAEFEKWSRFASEIREKAIAKEIEFEQYYEDIRK